MQVPFYRHSLKPEDAMKIAEVLKTPFLTSGPVCKDVEAQLVDYFGVKNAKLVSSWTNGAVAALLALDIGPGDEVIVPAMTFIATANVVELIGATPVFIDCDPDTLLITPELVKNAITSKTKAVIPVHMYGQMCDVRAIKQVLPKDKKIYILEDCAHAFEAKFNGDRPGKYSDLAIFSFYGTKNVTCGEGGAIITNDLSIYERVIQAVHHGMSASAADRFKTGKYNHWGMEYLGTKANLPDLLAALLPDQIKNIDEKLSFRENLAKQYENSLENIGIKFVEKKNNIVHSRHLFPISIPNNLRDDVLRGLGENEIGCTVNYRAIHTMNYYKNKYKLENADYSVSYEWGNQTISLPLFPDMKEYEQNHVIRVLKENLVNLMGRS